MIFFTSDTHFFHKNILEYDNRPWATLEDMHEGLISEWNSRVKDDDTVYFLGDFSFGRVDATKEILERLNGNIYCIQGNHDKPLCKALKEMQSPRHLLLPDRIFNLNYQNKLLILCHYPMLSWQQSNHGSYMLHGHSHGGLDELNANANTLRLDVGVSARHCNYRPISIDEVIVIMENRRLEIVLRRHAHGQ